MNKILKHKKEEKRLVKLLYKKGLLKDFKLKDLYWNAYSVLRKKKRKHGRKYRHLIYLPEVHYATTDYWGEVSEYSIVKHVDEMLYWENADSDKLDINGYPISTWKYMSRIKFIKYLKTLPTVVNNNKIRKVLNCKIDE